MSLPIIQSDRGSEFWSLLGLLMIAVSLIASKHFDLPFWYVSFGIACSFYGLGLYLYQLPNRRVYRGRTRRHPV